MTSSLARPSKAINKDVLSILLCLSMFCSTQGQISQLEFNQENDGVNMAFAEQEEWLQNLQKNPLNLNKASINELRDSRILSEQQIADLLFHIKVNGPLMSIYELQVIPSWAKLNLPEISSFFHVNNDLQSYNVSLGKLLIQGEHQIIMRFGQQFPKKSGHTSNNYLGNPSQIFMRYKYNYSNKLYYGFSGEKDAGEPMFGTQNKLGFDFYSAHLFWKVNRKLHTLAIGDYHLNLAQGLTVYTGFGFNKSTDQSNIKKGGNTLKPYNSINEANFLRGAAFTFRWNKSFLTPFYSYRQMDASFQYTDSTQSILNSLRPQSSGYHRTLNELNNKRRLGHQAYGAEYIYENLNITAGVRWIQQRFSQAIKFPESLHNAFEFQGKTLNHISMDYSFSFRKAHVFGETASSINKTKSSFAILHGLSMYPHHSLQLNLLHRYYSPYYTISPALQANAFAESTKPINEHGVFMGFSFKPNRRWQFAGYLDYYKFPWLSFQSKKPSDGFDFLCSLGYHPNKQTAFTLLYKREEKEKNTHIILGQNNSFLINERNKPFISNAFTSIDLYEEDNQLLLRPQANLSRQRIEETTFITPHINQSIRVQLSFQPARYWTLNTRLSFSFFNDQLHSPNRGTLLFQEVKFKHPELPIAFNARISYFDIQSFDSRIYTYESDVLYQFSIPSFFDSGIRYYLNTSLKVSEKIQIWMRFAHTHYLHVKSKGSGNDEIPGNKLYDLKLQLRLSF